LAIRSIVFYDSSYCVLRYVLLCSTIRLIVFNDTYYCVQRYVLLCSTIRLIVFNDTSYCVQRYVLSLPVNVQYVCSYNWTFCLFSALYCRTLSRYVKLMSAPAFRCTMWWSAFSTLLYPIFNRNVKLARTAEL
jgi:hypothetical protein